MQARALGLFHSSQPFALRPFAAGKYHVYQDCAMGGAKIWAEEDLCVCVWGRMRGRNRLWEEVRRAGIRLAPDVEDACLLAGAYRAFGEALAEKALGPVAWAVMDTKENRLLLMRDPMGENQVFYAISGQGVAFSEAPLPLLEAPGVTRVVDREGLCQLFGLGPARVMGKTPFRDLRELEPGCLLTAHGAILRIRPCFSLDAHEHTDSPERTVETVRGLLEEAVRETLTLQPAVMLSGGLDSGVTAALAAQMGNGTLRAFTVDYEDDARYFESNSYRPERDAPWAEKTARAIGAKQTVVELSADRLYSSVFSAVEARGFPGMADIDGSMLLFVHGIAPAADSVLMGECADEIFGGYPWYHREEMIWQESFPWSGSLDLRESVLQPGIREQLGVKTYVQDVWQTQCRMAPILPGEHPREARLRLLQWLVLRMFMPNLQERAVRMCMASGVTALTPFCDDRLMRYVFNVPWDLKNMAGETKGLLREAAKGLLPEELLRRKKSPYPKTCHPRYSELCRRGIAALAADPDAPVFTLCDRQAVLRLSRSALSPAETPWYGQLMAGPQMLAYLLQVDAWLRQTGAQIEC